MRRFFSLAVASAALLFAGSEFTDAQAQCNSGYGYRSSYGSYGRGGHQRSYAPRYRSSRHDHGYRSNRGYARSRHYRSYRPQRTYRHSYGRSYGRSYGYCN